MLFRVHEYNSICLVLTFLPYHSISLFTNMLSILPQSLPPILKFLHPYVQSLASPPRHVLVYAAAHTPAFYSALNTYVLKVGRAGYQHRAILSCWASITTEAVVSMLDQSGSGRREIQRQREEDVLLRTLPFLNEGLSIKKVADLRIGCYMLLTVLASKAHLEDSVLDAMMEAVTTHWTSETSHAGLICLSVLAQNKNGLGLPSKVYKAVMSMETLEDDLHTLKEQYRIDKLTLGLILGVLGDLDKGKELFRLKFVRVAIEARLLDHAHTTTAVESILIVANELSVNEKSDFDVQGQLADLLLRLSESDAIGSAVQEMIKQSKVDIDQLEAKLQTVVRLPEVAVDKQVDIEMEDSEPRKEKGSFELAAKHIPTRTAYEFSFLSESESYIFGSLSHAFLLASKSAIDLQTFSDFPVLRKTLALKEPLFLTFFIRIWCGSYPTTARVAAVNCTCNFFKTADVTADVQLMFPYIICALGDPSPKVRTAAAELVLILSDKYTGEKDPGGRPILGKDSIYGSPKIKGDVHWLSEAEASKVLENILVPNLEECRLDNGYISRRLVDVLDGSSRKKDSKDSPKIKTSKRVALLMFLSSHIIKTPLYSVKLRLLSMLSEVDKVGSTTRTKCLLPLLQAQAQQNTKDFKETCIKNHIDETDFTKQLLNIVSATDRDGLQVLQALLNPKDFVPPLIFRRTAFHRIRDLWSSVKHDMQLVLTELLLSLALQSTSTSSDEGLDVLALDTLRGLTLSANILLSLISNLPSLSSTSDSSPASKRRKTSYITTQAMVEHADDDVSYKIHRINVVLELTEFSKAGRAVPLLQVLFPLLADIQHAQVQIGTDLGYTQLLALNCLIAIVQHCKSASAEKLDGSGVRADLIVDCVRANSTPQVQQAALLLMSGLASVVSEVVIHSVMPVFTFMGSTILRQNDDYSAHIIDKTIDSIIPPLMATLRKKSEGPVTSASELLLSFVTAFEHIPVYRRQKLFHSLVEKLGPEDFLFAILAMLLDKYVGDSKIRAFAADLASQYNPTTQLHTLEKYLDLVSDSLNSKRTISERLLSFDEARRPVDIAANLLSLAPQLLSSQRLSAKISKIFAKNDDNIDASAISQSYSRIMVFILRLMVDFRQITELYLPCERVLNALLGHLSTEELIKSIESLLSQDDMNVRRQSLIAFEGRVKSQKVEDSIAQTACLEFLPQLMSIAQSSTDQILKHTAIACSDQIIEKYGKKDVAVVASVVNLLSGDIGVSDSDPRIQVISILCLATAIEVLREAIIPLFPKLMPIIVKHLQSSFEGSPANEGLHNAVYSFLEALITYVPWLLTGDTLDQVLRASHESANADVGCVCNQNRLDVLRLFAKQAEPRECISALTRTWPSAMTAGPEVTYQAYYSKLSLTPSQAIGEHLEILDLTVQKHSKSTITKHCHILWDLMLKIFDLRQVQLNPRTEDSYTDEEIERVEDTANQIAIKTIYKLNDTTFRPIFNRILEWATIPQTSMEKKGIIYRQTTWYKFLHVFFDTLKVCCIRVHSTTSPNYLANKFQTIVNSNLLFILHPGPLCHSSHILRSPKSKPRKPGKRHSPNLDFLFLQRPRRVFHIPKSFLSATGSAHSAHTSHLSLTSLARMLSVSCLGHIILPIQPESSEHGYLSTHALSICCDKAGCRERANLHSAEVRGGMVTRTDAGDATIYL